MVGLLGRTRTSSEFQRYEFADNKWSLVDDLFCYGRRWQPLLFRVLSRVKVTNPCLRRANYAVATFEGTIWILGGCMRNDERAELTYHREVFSFDLDSKEWTKELSMRNPRADFCAVVVGDRLYAIGGIYMNMKSDRPIVRRRKWCYRYKNIRCYC